MSHKSIQSFASVILKTLFPPFSQKMELEAVGQLHQVDEEAIVSTQLQIIRVCPAQHCHGNLWFGI